MTGFPLNLTLPRYGLTAGIDLGYLCFGKIIFCLPAAIIIEEIIIVKMKEYNST